MDSQPTDDSEVTEWVFEVVVETDTHEHAEQVMCERVDFSESYGFDYRIWLREPQGTPSHSESAKGITRMYAAAHPVEAIVGILESGAAKIHSTDEGNDYMDVSLTVRVMGADDRIKPATYADEPSSYGSDEPDAQAIADAEDAMQQQADSGDTTTES